MYSRLVPGWAPQTRASATNSSSVAKVGGVGQPSPSNWVADSELENPRAPDAERGAEDLAHPANLIGGRGGLGRGVSHDEATECRVAHKEADVHGEVGRFDDVEELGEFSPTEFDPFRQRLERNRFNPRQQASEEILVVSPDGGE